MEPCPTSTTSFNISSKNPDNVSSKEEILWRGRSVHESKSFLSPAFKAVVSGVLISLGLLLVSFSHPIIVMGLLVTGTFVGIKSYREFSSSNFLEEALKYLTIQKDLNKLPEMRWSYKDNNSRKIVVFDQSTMTCDVMALKEDGKTIAVVIKSFDPAYDFGLNEIRPANIVSVFSFKGRLEPALDVRTPSLPTRAFVFNVTEHMSAIVGMSFEASKRCQVSSQEQTGVHNKLESNLKTAYNSGNEG
jgi:hypothetical protein